jgi:PKD repeat protein
VLVFCVGSMTLASQGFGESDQIPLPFFQCTDEPPIAVFTYSPTSPLVGEEVEFDASRSSLPRTCPRGTDSFGSVQGSATALWVFGDGTDTHDSNDAQLIEWSLLASIARSTASHVYNRPGTFVVALILFGDNGLIGFTAETITVKEANQPPMAGFTWQTLSSTGTRLVVEPRTGDRIEFDAAGSSDPDGEIVTYS